MRKITKSAGYRQYEREGLNYKIGGTWGLLYRFLIIICRLLDKDVNASPQKKRSPSAWSLFAGDYMRKGKTIQEAAIDWKKRK